MPSILVIGSVNTDMIVKLPHLPAIGETVLGNAFYKLPGGKGANQAVAAQRAGGQVTFVACVGDDAFGQESIAGYQRDGIDVSHMKVIPGVSTGVALINVDNQGRNMITVASGANLQLTTAVIQEQRALIEQAEVLLLQLETPLDAVIAAIEIAHRAKRFIILNPAPAQVLPRELYSKITLMTPNETEAEILTGIKVTDSASARKAAECLRSYGVKQVIITLGAQGIFYSADPVCEHIPCFKVNAVDTTAAGDVFNGALAAALSQKKSFREALDFAQAASALSVTKVGAQSSVPKFEEIERFSKAAPHPIFADSP